MSTSVQRFASDPIRTAWVCIGLGVCVALLFSRTVFNEFFVLDDYDYVLGVPWVVEGLSWDGVRTALRANHGGNWHPLTSLSHMLDCTLFGIQPAGHHATSVVLHALNTSLLFLAFNRLTRALGASLFVALLFGVHPLRVESVAWVSERKDVLSGFFFMLTLLFYESFSRRGGAARYLGVLGATILGLLSKPMLVTLPGVLLLLDVWPLGRWSGAPVSPPGAPECRRQSLGWLLLEKVPLVAVAAVMSAITLHTQAQSMADLSAVSVDLRIINSVWSSLAYLGMAILPIDLAPLYPHPQLEYARDAAPWITKGFAAGAVIVAVTLLSLARWRSHPFGFVGWAWYIGMMLPVIGIVQVGVQGMADRYTYLPMIGVAAALSFGAADLARWRPGLQPALPWIAGACTLILAATTWSQIGRWQTSEAILEHAVKVTRNNYRAYIQLGIAQKESGHLDKASASYRKALNILPNNAEAIAELGSIFGARSSPKRAERLYRRALASDPNEPSALNNLGVLLAQRGDVEEALRLFERGILNPPGEVTIHLKMHLNLGHALLRLERYPEAISRYESALYLDKRNTEVLLALAMALERGDKAELARERYREVLSLDPENAAARARLGRVREATDTRVQ